MVLPGTCSSRPEDYYDYGSCKSTDDCPCPQFCVLDPAFPSMSDDRCETLCDADSDCTDPTATCVGGLCQVRTCDTPEAACSSLDAGDGTCLPGYFVVLNSFEIPLVCESGGSASDFCDDAPTQLPALDRSEPQLLCPVGQVCIPDYYYDFGSCYPACNPDGGSTCDGGTHCWEILNPDNGPDWGVCIPLSDAGCTDFGSNDTQNLMGALCVTSADCLCPLLCDVNGYCEPPQ